MLHLLYVSKVIMNNVVKMNNHLENIDGEKQISRLANFRFWSLVYDFYC